MSQINASKNSPSRAARRPPLRKRRTLPVLESLESRELLTIAFDFRYNLDASQTFAKDISYRLRLEEAGRELGDRLTDRLLPIKPTADNTWNATFTNPSTGKDEVVKNLSVPENTLIVYVGFRHLGGSNELGEGGPGGYSEIATSNDPNWIPTVRARGQSGALATRATDYGPWGGSIAFDIDRLLSGKNDFYSVALHELGHVLGIGTAKSWRTYVSGNVFTGPSAKAHYNNQNVPLNADHDHWAEGTADPKSVLNPRGEAAMTPTLTTGEKKRFTTLDFAALQDVGWNVIGNDLGGGVLKGRVTDANGRGVGGVLVAANCVAGAGLELGIPLVPLFWKVTDANGYYQGSVPAGGLWQVTADGRGLHFSRNVEVGPAGATANFSPSAGVGLVGSPEAVDLSGDYVILGEGDGANNQITIGRNGANLVVTINGVTSTRPLASLGAIKIRTLEGDDTVVIDFSGGNPIPAGGLFFDGGFDAGGGNTLILQGGTFSSTDINATGPGEGTITLDGSVIAYSEVSGVRIGSVPGQVKFTAANNHKHDFHVDAGGGLGLRLRESGGLADFAFATPTSLMINGGDGIDILYVDFNNGNPIPAGGLSFDGGAGFDSLVLQGTLPSGRFAKEVYTATDAGSGTISFDGSIVAFTNIEPIDDTVPVGSLSVNLPAGDQTVRISDYIDFGDPAPTFVKTEIASSALNPGFESIRFANKTEVTVATQGGNDVISLDNSTPATGLATLRIRAGAGNDEVRVSRLGFADGVTYDIDGGAGIDRLVYDWNNSSVSLGWFASSFEQVVYLNVAPLPFVSLDPAPAIAAVEGQNLMNVVVARFANVEAYTHVRASDYTAIIDWGDGTTSPGVVVGTDPSQFAVTGTHAYNDNRAYTIRTMISYLGGRYDDGVLSIQFTAGSPQTLAATATVSGASLTATGAEIQAVEGTLGLQTVATFSSASLNPALAAKYTALIVWGDGTTSSGVVAYIGGTSYQVTDNHTYRTPGRYPVTVEIRELGAGGASVLAQGTANVVDAKLTVEPATLATIREGGALSNTLVARIADANLTSSQAGDLQAWIDYGDGTPAALGVLTSVGASATGEMVYEVRTSHAYARRGSYTITVTALSAFGAKSSAGVALRVDDVPIVLTARLDPSSDSGLSSTDGITNVVRPTFNGTSEPFSIVEVLVHAAGSANSISVGRAVADQAGQWSITSTPLPDALYDVTVKAVDRFGDTTAQVTLPPLTIDTKSPVIVGARLRPRLGRLELDVLDNQTGLNVASLLNSSNYAVRRTYPVSPRAVFVTSVTTAALGTTVAGRPQTIVLTLNGGRKIGREHLVVSVNAAGIEDLAGNALDGDFTGVFPSGDGKPLGDFRAALLTNGVKTFTPQPVGGFADPKTPPGFRGLVGGAFVARKPNAPAVARAFRKITVKHAESNGVRGGQHH